MILFESGWETYAVNYLKSEALARGIIYNAAWHDPGEAGYAEVPIVALNE